MATNMEQLITQTLNRVSEKGEVTSADLFVLRYCQQAEARRNKTPAYKQMLNYTNRIIEPILAALVDEMNRKFLTKTARSQRQAIKYFTDPFRLVPINNLAEIADKFTRNEIMTSNEIRQITGMKPSKDPKADELRNSNLSAPKEQETIDVINEPKEENQNG